MVGKKKTKGRLSKIKKKPLQKRAKDEKKSRKKKKKEGGLRKGVGEKRCCFFLYIAETRKKDARNRIPWCVCVCEWVCVCGCGLCGSSRNHICRMPSLAMSCSITQGRRRQKSVGVSGSPCTLAGRKSGGKRGVLSSLSPVANHQKDQLREI